MLTAQSARNHTVFWVGSCLCLLSQFRQRRSAFPRRARYLEQTLVSLFDVHGADPANRCLWQLCMEDVRFGFHSPPGHSFTDCLDSRRSPKAQQSAAKFQKSPANSAGSSPFAVTCGLMIPAVYPML